MTSQRAKKRDPLVDAIRSINLFRSLGDQLGTYQPREVQRILQEAGVERWSEHIVNNKFLDYANGNHLPRLGVVLQAEQLAVGLLYEFDHVLWTVLRHPAQSVATNASAWVRRLAPEIQVIVMPFGRSIRSDTNVRYLHAIERHASIDGLAALTILFRLHHEQAEYELARETALSILRMLLLLGARFTQRLVAEKIFALFVARVFDLVRWDGLQWHWWMYSYAEFSCELQEQAQALSQRSVEQGERRRPLIYYSMRILAGDHIPWFKTLTDPLVGPDLDLGPPTQSDETSMLRQIQCQLLAARQARGSDVSAE